MDAADYPYAKGATQNHAHAYLTPQLLDILNRQKAKRVFDLGCGNGALGALLSAKGYEAVGVDPSFEGIALATQQHPGVRFELGSAYDDLKSRYGTFPIVVSIEVVEHLYSPRIFARTLFGLVESGGIAVVTTPYHGYLKNLALALTGKMDSHFTSLWDNGHIKFWSVKTLRTLLVEAGFTEVDFHFAGRFPLLAKSMIAVALRR